MHTRCTALPSFCARSTNVSTKALARPLPRCVDSVPMRDRWYEFVLSTRSLLAAPRSCYSECPQSAGFSMRHGPRVTLTSASIHLFVSSDNDAMNRPMISFLISILCGRVSSGPRTSSHTQYRLLTRLSRLDWPISPHNRCPLPSHLQSRSLDCRRRRPLLELQSHCASSHHHRRRI